MSGSATTLIASIVPGGRCVEHVRLGLLHTGHGRDRDDQTAVEPGPLRKDRQVRHMGTAYRWFPPTTTSAPVRCVGG